MTHSFPPISCLFFLFHFTETYVHANLCSLCVVWRLPPSCVAGVMRILNCTVMCYERGDPIWYYQVIFPLLGPRLSQLLHTLMDHQIRQRSVSEAIGWRRPWRRCHSAARTGSRPAPRLHTHIHTHRCTDTK